MEDRQAIAAEVSLRREAALERLSTAEREVAIALTRGWSTASLALARGVAVTTVSNQIASLFRKLDVTSRTELAARLADVALGGTIPATARRRDPTTTPKLLLLEDDARVRQEVGASFAALGHEVIAHHDVGDAREALAQAHFDVAVFDLRLGTRSSLELLRDPPRPLCPTVVMSGLADLGDALEALSLGAWDFVDKTAGLARLRVTVAEALRGAAPPRPLPTGVLHAEVWEPAQVLAGLMAGQLRFAGAVEHGLTRHLYFERCADRPLYARERFALETVLAQAPFKVIAIELGIAEVTAWGLVDGLLDRLGFRHRIEAVACLTPLARASGLAT